MSDVFPVKKEKMNTICKQSPYTQIGVGAVGGFVTGFVFLKASKLVALAAGAGILAFELAVAADVIQLDSIEICHDPSSDPVRGQIRIAGQTHQLEAPNLTSLDFLGEKAKKACASSRRLCVAFMGGFLLGFGFA